MPDSVSIDTRELRQFAVDLERKATRDVAKVPPIVKKGAQHIKDQLRDEMRMSSHFKGLAGSFSYDLIDGGFGAEVGPSTGGTEPGSLANIAYFGGSNGGGGTVPDPQGALDAETPKFLKALADVVGEL